MPHGWTVDWTRHVPRDMWCWVLIYLYQTHIWVKHGKIFSMSTVNPKWCVFLIDLLECVLLHTFFFNRKTYLHLQGTAMGVSCELSYANLFLGLWKTEIFAVNPVQQVEKVLLIWIRYINDIFFIWQDSASSLEKFKGTLNNNNNNNYNIKLIMTFTSWMSPYGNK